MSLSAQPLSLQSVNISKRYLWVRENKGVNRSTQIDAWSKPFGLIGQSWCMMFVWNINELAAAEFNSSCKPIKTNVKNPLKKTASCYDQLRYAKNIFSGLLVKPSGRIAVRPKVSPGDIGIISERGVKTSLIGGAWHGHTYIVDLDMGSSCTTIEGNTNNNGSREGIGVFARSRPKSKTLAFITKK